MSQQNGQHKGRSNKQNKVEHNPVVSINKAAGPGDFYTASIAGIEFCRMEYGHNRLLIALNHHLRVTSFDEQVAALKEGNPDLSPESIAALAKEFLEHHAAGITMYISHNLHFMFSSMMETYLNIGGLWAKQDREQQLGLDPQPITAQQIQMIFADLALQYVQRQAGAMGGRRPDIAKEKAKRDLERAAIELHREGRKLTYEEAEDVLGLGGGTLKGIVRRHGLGQYWKELKRSRNAA
ncbi:MAG: hypothetical protein ACJ754_10920 [Pyrinomonadaceae bacterium]